MSGACVAPFSPPSYSELNHKKKVKQKNTRQIELKKKQRNYTLKENYTLQRLYTKLKDNLNNNKKKVKSKNLQKIKVKTRTKRQI